MPLSRRSLLRTAALGPFAAALNPALALAATDWQPFSSQVRRLLTALDSLGAPLTPADLHVVQNTLEHPGDDAAASLETILDRYTLLHVIVNPESRVSVTKGAATPDLVQHGWRIFLVKVLNQGGITAPLHCESLQALKDSGQAPGSVISGLGISTPATQHPVQSITLADVADRWLDLDFYNKPPMMATLSGLGVEYRILQLYSRDPGNREASLSFNAGPATADVGYRNAVPVLFRCAPAHPVVFHIRDKHDAPLTASITISDAQGRVYPSRAKRLAPDFPFQNQIYRSDGDSLLLPEGTYFASFDRGPESLPARKTFTVSGNGITAIQLPVTHWIDAASLNWYPGDHHVHAAGCSHYNTPTEGVRPQDMAPQVRGEGLSFADILTWGPCWYHQKEFFRGQIDPVSTARSVLRYDVEVSGFPSSNWGHLVLLQLAQQDYPGTKRIEDWPTWNLPILRWAQSQNAVTGFAHTGHGLVVSTNTVPNYDIPAFDDNGANEFLIDVTHNAVDFLSACDTPAPAELNIWYHALNCGFRVPLAGETDFPCIFEKVGMGRTYVHLAETPKGDAGYRAWIKGLKEGSSYVSDGRSHILDFRVNDVALTGPAQELTLPKPGRVRVSARIAAYLPPDMTAESERIRTGDLAQPPFWHLERARVAASRTVTAELIVNGRAVASKLLEADGNPQTLEFETEIDRSSWITVRIFPSSHSNPIYVKVANAPIRASRRSAEWSLACTGAAWTRLNPQIASNHRDEAARAKDHALATFRQIAAESPSGS